MSGQKSLRVRFPACCSNFINILLRTSEQNISIFIETSIPSLPSLPYGSEINLYYLTHLDIAVRMSTNKSNDSNINETLAAAFGRPMDSSHSYKTMTSHSQNSFIIIAKIVKWLKERHLSGDSEPLTLDEILDETEQTDISSKIKTWLANEVLEQNARVRVIKSEDGQGPPKYQFKPIIDIKDRKTLRKFLMDRYQSGEGAIWMDDILESLPNANRAIKWLVENEHIVVITRPVDKKKVVFYNEGKQDFRIDEEFAKLWRSISVDGVAEDKIEEYLEKHGIQSIQDLASKKMEPVQKRRKVMRRPNKNFKAHNEHMKDILEDYSEK